MAPSQAGHAVSLLDGMDLARGTDLVGWSMPAAGRVPPLRPGLRQRAWGWTDLRLLLAAHRRLVAGLLLSGLAVGVAGALTVQPRTAAETLLMIGDDNPAAPAADPSDPHPPGAALQSEIALLHSDAVANRLVQQIGVTALFPDLAQPHLFGAVLFGLGQPYDDAEQMRLAAARAQQRITAAAVPGGAMLRVGYADADPAIAVRALRVIVDSYLKLRVDLAGAGNASRLIAQDASRTADQLRDLDGQIDKLRVDYQIVDLDQDIAAATARLDDVVKRASDVRVRQQAVAAELAAADAQLQAAPQRVFDAQETAARPLEEARATVLSLRLERDHLATQYAPTYPALVELDRKLASAQQTLQQSAKLTVSATRDVRNPALDVLRNRANDLRIEAAGLGRQLDALGVDNAHAAARLAELREAATRMHDLQYRRDVLEAVGRQISMREISLRVDDTLAQARQARVHVIQAPAVPAGGSVPVWPKWLLGGALGGLAAAGVGGLLATRLRRTYVLAREVERHLDIAVLGEFAADELALGRTGSQPQIAAIAAMLADSRVEDRPLFSMQAITPDADDDQRAVARAIAGELGGRFGLRTLVLDVGADGVAMPLALEGPGLGAPLPASLAGACLSLWDATEDAGAPAPPDDAGDAAGGALMLAPEPNFTAQTFANLRQSCDLLLLVAGGQAADETARRLAGFVDATLLVVAVQRTPVAWASNLARGVAARGGQMLGAVLTGRAKPAFTW